MFPLQSAAMRMQSIQELRDHYQLPPDLWDAFTQVAGNPGNDMRLLAVLPSNVVSAALERAQLSDGQYLSAVQASHVGLVCSLAKRIQHTRSGGDWDNWSDGTPFTDQRTTVEPAAAKDPSTGTDRKLKMAQILDQCDDGEFTVQTEETRAKWYQAYVSTVGGWPPEEEDPTLEQLSALQKRLVTQDTAPYVDFAIFVPFGQRALKASKFHTYTLTATGYVTKDLPGPANFTQWRTCYRLLKTALIMLDAVGLAALHSYEMAMERLARTYPTCWHLIYSADEIARSAQANRLRSRLAMEIRAGRPGPEGFSPTRPWDFIYGALARDEGFWQAQVHTPALAWIASGSRGTPKTPAEQLAVGHLQGGLSAIAPVVENSNGTKNSNSPDTFRRRKKRRGGRGSGGGEDQRPSKAATTEKGKGKGGKNASTQKCYSWNNGNGVCGSVSPGQKCLSKIPRLHKCTICDSPGHPSKDCPKKDA